MRKDPKALPVPAIGRWFLEGPKALGTLIFVAHTVLALLIFIWVHFSSLDAQAGIQWAIVMGLDLPVTYLVWEYIVPTEPMQALAEWGNSWGSGDNLRALILHGTFGGAQWFAVGWLVGSLFMPKTGWIAKWFGKPT